MSGDHEHQGVDVETAFTQFVTARWAALYRFAFHLTGQSASAEDLVQTALVKTYAVLGRLHDPHALEGYVRRAIVTTHHSAWRRHRGREWLVDDAPESGRGPDGADDFETVLARTVVWPHLAALPKGQRTAIVLRYLEDMTEAQAADVMGCSVGNVKSQTSRGLATLRAALHGGSTGSGTAGATPIGRGRRTDPVRQTDRVPGDAALAAVEAMLTALRHVTNGPLLPTRGWA